MTGRLRGRLYLRPSEAAERLGLTPHAVRRALRERRLEGRKFKGRWKVLASVIYKRQRRVP